MNKEYLIKFFVGEIILNWYHIGMQFVGSKKLIANGNIKLISKLKLNMFSNIPWKQYYIWKMLIKEDFQIWIKISKDFLVWKDRI